MADKKVAANKRATVHDFDVIVEPVITEKTMSLYMIFSTSIRSLWTKQP